MEKFAVLRTWKIYKNGDRIGALFSLTLWQTMGMIMLIAYGLIDKKADMLMPTLAFGIISVSPLFWAYYRVMKK